MKIEDELYKYFYNHPAKSMDDFLVIAKKSYDRAKNAVIPVYQPKKVVKLTKQLDDGHDVYDDSKIIKHETYKDESTFAPNDEDNYE